MSQHADASVVARADGKHQATAFLCVLVEESIQDIADQLWVLGKLVNVQQNHTALGFSQAQQLADNVLTQGFRDFVNALFRAKFAQEKAKMSRSWG